MGTKQADLKGEQLLDSNKLPAPKDELIRYIDDILDDYIDLRNLPEPYYNWNSVTDKWAEYDRCYELRAENDREEYQYKGNSNIVLPDYHAAIETLKTREVNQLFSGKDLFEAMPTKLSTIEDAIIAKKLVKHNFNSCKDYRTELTKVEQDRLNYGTCFAKAEWTIDEIKRDGWMTERVDEEGNQIYVDGVPQEEPQPYFGTKIIEKKYTSFKHLDAKTVYLHPRIEKMKDQECVFLFYQKSNTQIIQMEKDGIIAKGMADEIKKSRSNYNDPDLDDAQDSRSDDDDTTSSRDEARVHDIYVCYFYWGEDDKRKLYEGIYLKDELLVGIREYDADNIADFIIKARYIAIPGYAYGIGVGDEQYPVYISKCARFNQVFDLSTKEIKSGGLKDPNLISDNVFQTQEPGVWYNTPGLSALLQTGGKPMLSWGEIEGRAPSSTGLDVIPLLNEAIQHGTGATNLLAGMPTDSNVDDTATGIQSAINAGNERVNTYLQQFEVDMVTKFAEISYKNYQINIENPQEELPKILDQEELYYKDEQGQKVPLAFPNYLLDIDFRFYAVERVVDSEKQIGKMMRLMMVLSQLVGQTSQFLPELGLMILEKLNWEYVITELARNIGVADLDKLFPDFNPVMDLIKTGKELEQVQQKSGMMEAMIGEAMNQFKETGNQTAIDTVNNIMQEVADGAGGQNTGANSQNTGQ